MQQSVSLKQAPTAFSSQEAQTELSDYIRERASGEIIRDSFRLYRKHFLLIFLIFSPIAFSFRLLHDIVSGTETGSRTLMLLRILSLVMTFIAGLPAMLLVSQIYLGYELSLARAFKRLTPAFVGKALITGLLALVFYPWLLFSVPVMVLEGGWGFKALKRSLELGRYYYIRNFLVYIWPYTFYVLIYFGVNSVFTYLYLSYPGRHWLWHSFIVLKDILFALTAPVFTIVVVLLYYDMRIRNEGYDIVSLAEELKR